MSLTNTPDDRLGGPALTSAVTNEQQKTMPPPPLPTEITYSGRYSVNPLAEVSLRRMCAQIPAVLGRIARLSRQTDRRAVQLLLGCQMVPSVFAAVLLAATARATAPVLGDGTADERLRGALPTLLVVALAAVLARLAGAVAAYAEQRITPRPTTMDPATVWATTGLVPQIFAQ